MSLDTIYGKCAIIHRAGCLVFCLAKSFNTAIPQLLDQSGKAVPAAKMSRWKVLLLLALQVALLAHFVQGNLYKINMEIVIIQCVLIVCAYLETIQLVVLYYTRALAWMQNTIEIFAA